MTRKNEFFCFFPRGKKHYIVKLEKLLERYRKELQTRALEIAKLKPKLEVATTSSLYHCSCLLKEPYVIAIACFENSNSTHLVYAYNTPPEFELVWMTI